MMEGTLSLTSFAMLVGLFGINAMGLPHNQDLAMYYPDTFIREAIAAWLENATTAEQEYGHISEWNVEGVTDMSNLVSGASEFNEDLSQWDVRSVTDMRSAFYNAPSFNSDLSQWNVSNVRDMSHMFHGASSFNSDLSGWDTVNVFNFSYTFCDASSFNGDVSTWDITNAYDLSHMFHNAESFNSDLSSWTMEQSPRSAGFQIKWAQNMSSMFQGASAFNSDLSEWATFAVLDMSNMFRNASSFNSDISYWNVGLVRTFENMFSGSAFNQGLCWNVDESAEMTDIFGETQGFFEQDCPTQDEFATGDQQIGAGDGSSTSRSSVSPSVVSSSKPVRSRSKLQLGAVAIVALLALMLQ